MSAFPNVEPKPVGAYVVNVHPCGRYDDAGVVLQVSGIQIDGDTLTVATGTGSTCYGPARNWAPTNRPPEWLDRARPDFLERLARRRDELAPPMLDRGWTPAAGYSHAAGLLDRLDRDEEAR